MKPKQIVRITVDILMTVLFVTEMAYHITGNFLHEVLGTLLFALFILHNILNLKWYANLFNGKYSGLRILMVIINTLLFISMIGMMVSGILLSRDVFSFLNLRAGMFGRRLHMVSTSWGYLLMSMHIGLHAGAMLGFMKRRIQIKKRIACAFTKIIPFLIATYGVYAVIVRQLIDRMFLLMEYAFFDYEEPAIFFFADYLSILFLFAASAYYLSKHIKPRKGVK